MKPRRDKVFIDPYYQAYYKINDKMGGEALTVGRVTGYCGTVMRNVRSVTYSAALEKGKKDALELRRPRG